MYRVDLPLFYESGNQVRRDSFIDKIKTGQNCILFTPRGHYQSILITKTCIAKCSGEWVHKGLNVDEAHLIEAWGIDFRDDFQELGSLREKLISASPKGEALRTIFLSATIAPSSKSTLKQYSIEGKQYKR